MMTIRRRLVIATREASVPKSASAQVMEPYINGPVIALILALNAKSPKNCPSLPGGASSIIINMLPLTVIKVNIMTYRLRLPVRSITTPYNGENKINNNRYSRIGICDDRRCNLIKARVVAHHLSDVLWEEQGDDIC